LRGLRGGAFFMSFAIIRMQKFKAADVKGIQIHNYREKESHTNPDIDHSKTKLNYDLLNSSPIDFKEAIQKEIDERYTGQRAIRKDAVRLCEFVITSDKEFFDRLSPEEEKRFFEESLSFLQNRYGKENFLYGIVHKDEKTPHMHVGMVPITKDGKLAAKQFFGKKTELQSLQTDFHKHITEKGFDLERGVSSDRKHIETQRLKAITVKEELERLEDRLQDVKKSVEHAKKIDQVEVKESGLFGPKSVKLAVSDFEEIKTLAKASEALRTENKALQRENERIKAENKRIKTEKQKLLDENRSLRNEINDLKKNVQTLERENLFLKRTLERLKAYYNEKVQNFSLMVGAFKATILDKMGMKLLKKYFTDEHEIEGGQGYLAVKRKEEAKEKEKQEMLRMKDQEKNEKKQERTRENHHEKDRMTRSWGDNELER